MPARIRTGLPRARLLLISAVCAQRPPPFSVPDIVPKDLQIDGEWWFYSLLDSQFRHDVLTPLPESVVGVADKAHGTPKFLALPDAQYILLEFFAPWCPHCQHFAPEMVKLVTALKGLQGADGIPLVAVRTVDCEKLDMTALCNWADANMMPRLVFASSEALAVPLAPTSAQTPGVKEFFPVASAEKILAWLRQQVPGWPPSSPTAEPFDRNVPFFGWSQPLEGAEEPAQAPIRDLEVAVVSLLHEAFSSLDFTNERQQALFDLLELLCHAGPGGGSCRQSACRMHTSLKQRWGKFLQETMVMHNAQGDPMPATTFHYLDWAAVEREHRWCDRPWPDFAQEGWSWCRGRTPGTRGYTCGLWLLFHGLLAGAAAAKEPAAPKAPLEVLRGTVSAFFGCADCRQKFLAVPVTEEDLASPKIQALWLWQAHNLATARIAQEELKHNGAAPPRQQWPSSSSCPACRTADGSWDLDRVYKHLRAFYGPAFAAQGTPPQDALSGKFLAREAGWPGRLMGKHDQLPGSTSAASPAQGPRVSVEVYYYTLCPHCEYFLKLGMRPLVEAGLPGSLVQITLLPIYPPLLRWVEDRGQCLAHEDCFTALAPLCALKAVPAPAPADSPELLSGARFAECDISYTAAGRGRDLAETRGCAEAAGLAWSELWGCANGTEASALLRSGSHNLIMSMGLLHNKAGFQEPPSMPWVFLNGDLLLCDDGRTCTAVQAPTGDRLLPAPGSLLSIVCSHLDDPQPPGCLHTDGLVQAAQGRANEDAGGESAEQVAVKRAQACQNCGEVGAFRWSARPRIRGLFVLLLAMALVALGTLAALRTSWRKCYRGPRAEGTSLASLSAGADGPKSGCRGAAVAAFIE
uniref:Sulfhydryl oxidase n=1 Tax=Alexandrium monilatum TaxID=311494 RepID=A0A7S4PY61_9DINO